jgi:hypothetical protein
VQPVLEQFTVTVAWVRGPSAAGLAAFRCTYYGHVFFVRANDLETREAA